LRPETPSLRRGRIVLAAVEDRNGFRKERPCVILTPTHDIREGGALVVLAITTTFPSPAPPDCVELPWHPQGHPVTRLRRRSAAVIGWYDEISASDVLGYAGDVPARIMLDILARVEAQGELHWRTEP
jgi:hypothetical protein